MKLKNSFPEIMSLKNSPLFNLSLTNKELFHSNFIAWFGRLYPELFIQLISDLLGDSNWADGLDVKKMDIRREYNNFDISVFDSEDSKVPRLIIENKVKSLPTQAQLKEYEQKINDNESVALILLTMNDLTEDESDTKWKKVNYKTLSRSLQGLIGKFKEQYHYHLMLVEDYCQYVCELQEVICNFTSGENFFYDSDYLQMQKELGIHDVCGKRKIQDTYSRLVRELNAKSIDVVHKLEELKEKPSAVYVAWGYTNMQPLIEVKLKTKTDIDEFMLIQIQGQQYRHAVEYFDKQLNDRIEQSNEVCYPSDKGINYLKETYPEFLFGDGSLNNYPVFDTQKVKDFGQRAKDGKDGYCKYCNGKPSQYNGLYSCFVYQWVKLPENITISKLIDAIVSDISNLRNLYLPIKNLNQ